MKNHIIEVTVSPNKIYCSICGKEFSYPKAQGNHTFSKHPKEIEEFRKGNLTITVLPESEK